MRALKLFAISAVLAVSGCAYHPIPQTVYGATGKAYTAPSLCAALIACKNSTEPSCYYERDLVTNLDGSHMESGCKEVSK